MITVIDCPTVYEEEIIDSAIENAEKHNLRVDDEEIDEWEWHFKEKSTDELLHILRKNERKYIDSYYRPEYLEQIVAINRVLKERRYHC